MERIRAYKFQKTGEPVVWYHRNQGGVIQLFDLMGFDPETGNELLPVSGVFETLLPIQFARPARPPR
jgi:hypothetical protein